MRLLILFLSISALNCLKTDSLDVEYRVESFFEATNFNKEIIVDTDTLVINEIKFLVNNFSITTVDSTVINKAATVPALINGYYLSTVGRQLVFSVGLGYDTINNFEKYSHTIGVTNSQIPINDDDFFGKKNYSLIIKGSFNGKVFNLKSDTNFTKSYASNEIVKLTDSKNTLVIHTLIDIKNLFQSNDGALINPLNENNLGLIVNKFRENLDVSISKSSSTLFF